MNQKYFIEGDEVSVLPMDNIKQELHGKIGIITSWVNCGYLVMIEGKEYLLFANEMQLLYARG